MISIIVPIYNGETHLDACIQSVLRQTSPDWELLLVDDGSADATPNICAHYLSDGRVKYFRKPNSGVQDTRWFGLERASGRYVVFLDADDILVSSSVGILQRYLEQEIDILTFGMQRFILPEELREARDACFQLPMTKDKCALMKKILSGKCLSCVCGGVYRREMLMRHEEQFRNRLRIGEDTMFNLELAYAETPCVAELPAELYGYRINEQSVSHTYDNARLDAVHDAILYLKRFLLRTGLEDVLKREAGFRFLLLWSTYVFHPDATYYPDKAMRKRMKRYYFPAFRYLYPYLRVYLFIDLFLFPIRFIKPS